MATPYSAAPEAVIPPPDTISQTSTEAPAAADAAADGADSESEEETTSVDALYTEIYASPEEKLATMKLMTTKGNYSIYALESSGEVAVKDLSTGQILFTNPYDIGAATASESVKNEILSQIIVKFDENGREREYTSFEMAALRDQIKVNPVSVNHFTWLTEAKYKDIDLFPIYKKMCEKYGEEGYGEITDDNWMNKAFSSGEKVKMDLFNRFGFVNFLNAFNFFVNYFRLNFIVSFFNRFFS